MSDSDSRTETETEEQEQRRLEREAGERLGVIVAGRKHPTDTARVEVQWFEAGGRCRCGHYIVEVACEQLADAADESAQMENAPASRAEEATLAHLAGLAERYGWDGFEVLDVRAT